MDGGTDRGDTDRPTAERSAAGAGSITGAGAPLVGRHDALRAFSQALTAPGADAFQFLCLTGEPGAGKTRLLSELAAAAAGHELPVLWGRAAEFEQEMPFGAVIDALDDHLEAAMPGLAARLGTETSGLLATAFPGLQAEMHPPGGPGDLTGRY